MDEIKKCIDELLAAVRSSEEYLTYKEQEEVLGRDPELMARVDQFRSSNFKLQNEANRDELFSVVEQLARESKELRKIPEVNAYLDAELALCKMMQRICRSLTEGTQMHVLEL